MTSDQIYNIRTGIVLRGMLDALAALPDTADIELEIPPRSTAQRRHVDLD